MENFIRVITAICDGDCDNGVDFLISIIKTAKNPAELLRFVKLAEALLQELGFRISGKNNLILSIRLKDDSSVYLTFINEIFVSWKIIRRYENFYPVHNYGYHAIIMGKWKENGDQTTLMRVNEFEWGKDPKRASLVWLENYMDDFAL